jgi:glycosyltransferase involved in cell wall biosynthesis
MLISVIIPCYNSELYVSEAVNSVLNQSYKNIEVICVDNGSTDNTVNILNQICDKDNRVKILFEQKKGAAYARNRGLEKCRGEIIQFLDSDDILAPGKFENQISHMIHEGFDVVVSDRLVKDVTLTHTIQRLRFPGITEAPLGIAISEIIITGNPIYKRYLVNRVKGYTEELRMAQDWDFHIKIFLTDPKVGYVPGFYLISRQVETSLSSNWKKVSFCTADRLIFYTNDLISKSVTQDLNVYKKVFYTFLLSAIYVKNKNYKREYLNELKKWPTQYNYRSVLGGVNKLLVSILGISGFVRFKRIVSKKETHKKLTHL